MMVQILCVKNVITLVEHVFLYNNVKHVRMHHIESKIQTQAFVFVRIPFSTMAFYNYVRIAPYSVKLVLI